ncbi:hypothetical protein GOP47_0024622 [Adiantum capillus-veneris]|uniref:Uncharacterized protein n=1 Tax=Adiantum capillus-veneris TaxID=13818 RepID=A0A9D4Z4I9_ADICA|nr:hypothetical protein GOP47_0024622 [Adiantum capillus-veneris]
MRKQASALSRKDIRCFIFVNRTCHIFIFTSFFTTTEESRILMHERSHRSLHTSESLSIGNKDQTRWIRNILLDGAISHSMRW